MKRYPIRVLKYAIQLTVLLLIIFILMRALGQTTMQVQDMATSRGLMMLAAVVFFALIYPFFGFAKRTLTFDASKNVETVDKALNIGGFKRIDDDPANLIYQAGTPTKRLLMMYEDTITVKTEDGISVIEGMRKDVVKAYLRMDIYLLRS